MKCRFINCDNEAGDHTYSILWDNCCKDCLEDYLLFELGDNWKDYATLNKLR